MFERTLVLALLGSALAPLAAAADTSAWQDLTVAELCVQRRDAAAWAELERRRIFSQRDLNAIRSERIRPRIGVQALLCFMGEPERVAPAGFNVSNEPVDAWYYTGRDGQRLVVRVRHGLYESSVIDFSEIS